MNDENQPLQFTSKFDFINMTLDTECAMRNDHDKIIFDIAWTICNINRPNFEFMHKERYIVKETYEHIGSWIWRTKKTGVAVNYDFDETRFQQLHSDVIAGRVTVLSWREIYNKLMSAIWSTGVKGFTAYNLKHDWMCLAKTHNRYCHEQFMLPSHVETWCSMDFVGTELLGRKYFDWVDSFPQHIIEEYNLKTEGGNYGYSAEIAGKYLYNDVGYAEKHTSLPDATMETSLNTYCFRLHKNRFHRYLGNIQFVHWTYFKNRLTSIAKRAKRDSKAIKPLVVLPKHQLIKTISEKSVNVPQAQTEMEFTPSD
tara:strand:+ start:135 stop:1070 length:936 start_codon:yes stop_codon:yes gene_type:complete